MIVYYPPTMRRQLLLKNTSDFDHAEQALDDLVSFQPWLV